MNPTEQRESLRANTAYGSARTFVSILALVQILGSIGLVILISIYSELQNVASVIPIAAVAFADFLVGCLTMLLGQAFIDIADASLASLGKHPTERVSSDRDSSPESYPSRRPMDPIPSMDELKAKLESSRRGKG